MYLKYQAGSCNLTFDRHYQMKKLSCSSMLCIEAEIIAKTIDWNEYVNKFAKGKSKKKNC